MVTHFRDRIVFDKTLPDQEHRLLLAVAILIEAVDITHIIQHKEIKNWFLCCISFYIYIYIYIYILQQPGKLGRYSDELRAGRPGFDSRQGRDISLLYSVQTGSEAHPASYPMGTGTNFKGVKRPERKADHSHPSSAEVKNGGAIPSLPHMSSWHSA
jgi:hypothetical protein